MNILYTHLEKEEEKKICKCNTCYHQIDLDFGKRRLKIILCVIYFCSIGMPCERRKKNYKLELSQTKHRRIILYMNTIDHFFFEFNSNDVNFIERDRKREGSTEVKKK